MNRRLFLAAAAAGSAGLGALWTGRLIEAQESGSILTLGDPRILAVLERDTDRILRRVLSDGWNADRLHALATNVSVASLSMDDRLLERRMEQEIAEMGGEGAALAHVVVGRHLERELQELGFEDPLPYYSMDELREALTELREKGWSRIMAEASAGMLQSAEDITFRDTLRMLGEGGDGGEDNEKCIRRCQRARRDYDKLAAAALFACAFMGPVACKIAAAVALYAFLYMQAVCERCH